MSFWSKIAPIALAGAGTAFGGPVGGMAGGAIGGMLAGDEKQKRAQAIEDKSRMLASETARYSPWTGMTPGAIQYAGSGVDEIGGGALAGGVSGLSIGQAFGGAAKPPTALQGAGSSPYSLMSGQQLSTSPEMEAMMAKYSRPQQQPTMFANNTSSYKLGSNTKF